MSANLITLQDHDICVHTPDAVLARSPGFANIAKQKPLFGEAARQEARLHPRQSFNHFWSQLSLDPLVLKNSHFRHSADLAHGHLLSLTSNLSLTDPTVLAVPSHYTRAQLSVLLGVVKTCDIPVSGLVDLALLQAISAGSAAQVCIIVDLQLHQAVLTSFHRVNGQMQRDQVIQVPASGLLALQDAWTNMLADEFIRQTRFDPKHNAEVEQYLYNQLEPWISQSAVADELLIELNHKGTVHQARITHAAFAQRSRSVFERINRELEQLGTQDSSLHVLRSHLQLPGLTASLAGVSGIDDSLLMASCLGNLDHILKAPEQVQFVTRLPLASGVASAAHSAQVKLPTHVVLEHKALPLPTGRLAFGVPAAGTDFTRVVPLPTLSKGTLVLNKGRNQLQLELHELDTVKLNGNVAVSGSNLTLGDCLQLGSDGPTLHFIQVE